MLPRHQEEKETKNNQRKTRSEESLKGNAKRMQEWKGDAMCIARRTSAHRWLHTKYLARTHTLQTYGLYLLTTLTTGLCVHRGLWSFLWIGVNHIFYISIPCRSLPRNNPTNWALFTSGFFCPLAVVKKQSLLTSYSLIIYSELQSIQPLSSCHMNTPTYPYRITDTHLVHLESFNLPH